jgi:hypothetical protein
MSVYDVIGRPGFKTGTFTVTRYAAGSYAAGVFTAGGTSTFSIDACILDQGRKLKVGPEGQSGENVKAVWTLTELRASPGTPDEVSIGGEAWKVFEVAKPEGLGGSAYRAWVARKVVP